MTLQKPKVLYIEDNQLNIRLIQRSLRTMGYDLMFAEDGDVGLEMAYEQLPNVILVDINLPTIDGTEVIKALRENPATKNTPIVVLTADNTAKTQRICQEYGSDAYLTKPVSRSRLLNVLKMFISGTSDMMYGMT